MRRPVLFLFVVMPGVAAVGVCGYYLLQDWSALISAFARFERLEREGAPLRSLFVAQTYDQVYRINAFADGVGVMLGAILAAIGMHGLCMCEPAGRSAPEPDAAPLSAGVREPSLSGAFRRFCVPGSLALLTVLGAAGVCASLISGWERPTRCAGRSFAATRARPAPSSGTART